jgi:hypothetical protein
MLSSILGVISFGVCADARGQASSGAAGASHAAGAASAAPTSSLPASDVVVRRDGTLVPGTVLSDEPGKPVVVLGANGVITIPREDVDHVLASGSPPRAPPDASTAESRGSIGNGSSAPANGGAGVLAASERIAGLSLGGDIRLDANVLFKRYRVADGSDTSSSGAEVGAMASISLHFRGAPAVEEDGGANWLDFELGISGGAHDGFWKVEGAAPTGIVDGETAFIIGPHYALGHLRPTRTGVHWSGAVLGVAWIPTYVSFFGRGDSPSRGQLNPAGVRLTVDVGGLSTSAGWPAPMLRLLVGWLPDVGPLPTTINAGVGCAFY